MVPAFRARPGKVSGVAGWLFIFTSILAVAAPAWAGVKTVNGISAEVNLANAQRGVPYSQAIIPTGGGGAPYTFQMTAGSLPAGYTLSSAGTVSGINCSAANGGFPFSVRITSSTGTIADFTGSAQFSLQMTAGPGAACSLTLAALPTTGTVGTVYSGTASITGGTAPYTWTLTGGALPAGLALNTANGAVTGTPTTAGSYGFTISATDSGVAAGLRNYTVTIAPVITVNPATLANGLQALPYSQTVTASGGSAPYSFAVTAGAVPTGLSLSPTGLLSGTPTVPGSYNFTITATDAGSFTGSRAYALEVSAAPAIVIGPASLPGGLQNLAYAAQNLTASGGTAPYAYAVTGGALPAGIALSSGGVISGTPVASGTFNFTVTATDAVGYTASRIYSLVVTPQPAIVIDPATLPAALQDLGYSQTISASGGTAAYAFAVTSGALPAGLALSSAGALSGTATVAGTFNFTVTATDANTYTAARAYVLTVTAAPTIVVTPLSIPGALQSQPYSQALGASGGTGPYTLTVSAGGLPAGVSLTPSGLLAGTPSVSGTFSFTVQAVDVNGYSGTRAFSLAITPEPTIALAPASLPTALEHLPYAAQTISASGGTAPYEYAVTSGSLPAGMTLSSGGVLSGTPSDPGPFTFTVTATDADNYTGSRVYTLDVTEAPTITLTPIALPGALENLPYATQTITASGGTAVYSYGVTGGSLPAGVTLAGGGALSGTPTQNGTFNFTVTATDANGYTGARSYSLLVTPQPIISLSPVSLPDAFQNQAYASQTLLATGGTAPYDFAVSGGSLPAGMSLATSGALTGTPTTSGSFGFQVTATDANGYTGSRAYTLDVTAQPTITVSPPSLPGALQNQAYAMQSIAALGGAAPYIYALTSGALPAGLVLDPDGTLSGTPTAAGSFGFSVTATDTNNYTGVRAYTLAVAAAPTINVNPASVPDGLQGLAYATQAISATGGNAPYTFDISSGALPVGLALTSGGTLSGTPTSSGSFSFTITATDADNYSGSRAYTMNVTPASTISVGPASLPAGNEDLPYTQVLTASGGTGPYTLLVTAGALPAGISLASSGALTGTPTVNGTFSFTVTATDSLGFSGSQAYALDIVATPTITLAPASLAGGLQDQAYPAQVVTASGGTAPYSYQVTAGSLPTGLSLDGDGTLSGMPTVPGSFAFTVTATDANGYNGSRAYSIVITPAPTIVVNPAALPAAMQGLAYASQTLTASGGTGPYSFATTAGSLPAGMSLAADGTLSGTPATSGSFGFTVTATDADGYAGDRAYVLSVASAPTITLSPLSLPVALEDRPYAAQNVVASGGTAPYTYAITSGALPSGLSFTGDGVLSGTPGVSGSFTFTVTATDADGYTGSLAYTLSVTLQPTITLSPVSLSAALENQPYAAQAVVASGGTGPYSYAVSGGALPAGMAFSAAGVLSGTPTASGTFNFTVTATDADGYTANRSYTLDVGAQPTITLSPVTLPTALQHQPYAAQTIVASGGTPGYSFAISAGALPAGLELSGAGVISGTPAAAGVFTFTVSATDADGYSGSLEYMIDVTAAPVILISPATLPPTLQGSPYSQIIAAAGGTPAYIYAVTSGALPAGLSLASGGALTGTATASGTYAFTVTATDADGYSADQDYALIVNAPLQAAAGDPVPAITAGGAITPFTPVTAVGGVAPYTYSISPGLPAGMSFDPATGQVAGTPTQSQPLTSYTVTIQDASGATATLSFDLQVLVSNVSFTPATADLGRAGLPVDLSFVGAGGVGPYVFAQEGGTLPDGLLLDSSGRLTGRSAQAGVYAAQLRVTDNNGVTAVQTVTFTVDDPRPDPTLDAGVRALQSAQADSIRRFGRVQADNTVRRLEQLRGCHASANTVTVQAGSQDSVPLGQLTEGVKQADCSQARSAWIAGTVVMTDGIEGYDGPTTDGFTVGMDWRVTDELTLGLGLGYSNEDEDRLAGGATLQGDGYNALAYGAWRLRPQVYVEGVVGYGNASYDLARNIAEDNVRASASRDASHWFGSLGIAADLSLSRTYLQPYLRTDYQSASFDAYRESSVSSFALRYDSLDSDTTRYTGGVRAHWAFELSAAVFEPMLRLEYRGENRSSLNQRLRYADGLDGIDYTLRNASDDVSSGLVGAGFGLRFPNGFSADLEYQASFGSDLPDEQSISAMMNWSF